MELTGLEGGLYQPLSMQQIETIHEAALTILEKTGLTYESGLDDLLDLLPQNDIRVDRDKARIFFPREAVASQTAKAPHEFTLYSRDGSFDLNLARHRVHLGTGGAAIKILDPEDGQPRPPVLNDLYQLARLVDALENIHFFLRPCIPSDIPLDVSDLNVFYTCMNGTRKHIMGGVTDVDGLHKVMDLAAMVSGGMDGLKKKPFISITSCFAISPLKLCTQSTLIMQAAVRNHIPVALSSAPMSGSTSPMTMAGTLAQLHAELLAGITISQLTSPHAPVLYGGIPGRANLGNMGYLGGSIECGMMNAAIHQLAHHIGVPNYNSSGLSDSKIPDTQAGWEKALTSLLAAMSGSNYIHHAAGMLESMLTIAYEQYVIDDEIIGMCCKVLQGIEIDAEHLALDVIDAVGPGGNYMTSPHTMQYMRTEYLGGNGVTDSKSRDLWEDSGSPDTRSRAHALVKKILSQEPTSYIPKDVDRAIRKKYHILLPE